MGGFSLVHHRYHHDGTSTQPECLISRDRKVFTNLHQESEATAFHTTLKTGILAMKAG